MQITISLIPPILSPLTAKNTSLRCVLRHRSNCFSQQRQPRRLVQPRSLPFTRREQLIKQRRVDHADDRVSVNAQRNANAEHWEAMREVHGAIEGVDDPGWGVGDEILL